MVAQHPSTDASAATGPPPPDRGAIAALLRTCDLTRAPLGPVAGWSRALAGTVDTLLAARMQIVLFWGPDYVALYNDDYAPTIGDKHPRAFGRPARENWAELWDDLAPLLARVRDGGESIGARDRPFYIERSGQGETVYFDISYSPVRDDDGSIGGVLCIVSETTERVLAERRSADERERLATMFKLAPGFMAMLREPGHILDFANGAYAQLIGRTPVLGTPLIHSVPEIAAQGFVALLDEVVATGVPYTGRNVPVALDRGNGEPGAQRVIDFVLQPVMAPDGTVTNIFAEGVDVTDKVEAERELAISRDSLRLAVETAEIGTWDCDLASGTVTWSERTYAMFGIPVAPTVTVADITAAIHPDDRAAVEAAFAATVDPYRRAPCDSEHRTVGRDGTTRWVAVRGRGIFDGDTCLRALGTVIDITARKQVQEELRESEQRFRSIADSAPALIWMCDEQGHLVFANRWHERTFGRPARDLLGAGWREILHRDDVAGFRADFDRAFAARLPFGRDVRVIDGDGATRWLHSEARPREHEGRFAGYVGVDVDITEVHDASEALERGIAERTGELAASNRQLSTQIEERERVEATLRQMQRLEAVGQLTSGVAHDFNNLLTVILGNIEMLGRAGLDERAQRRLGYMRSAAERGATLTAQLLAFSRRQRLEAHPIDLNATVASMRDLIQSSMGGSVRLETRLTDALWPALVDPTQIELIILNLAINARDAMEVGGRLTVETANVTLGEPRRPEEPAAGDYIMIAVADSGTGMTAEVRAKAFEPFFTTKEVGKGSGLGLAQVYGFLKQSGGGVAIETALGIGTTVRVYLPRAAERRREPRRSDAAATAAAPMDASGRRIVVVDDDAAVRDVTASALRRIGADVVEAGSGGAALQRLQEMNGGVDLLVVDFAMPGMNGAELVAAAHARWPALPALYVTGYADLTAIAAVSAERIVQKPFHEADLARKVVALLARAAA